MRLGLPSDRLFAMPFLVGDAACGQKNNNIAASLEKLLTALCNVGHAMAQIAAIIYAQQQKEIRWKPMDLQ